MERSRATPATAEHPRFAHTLVPLSVACRTRKKLLTLRRTCIVLNTCLFFFSSRRRHTRSLRDWSSDVCSFDRSEEQTPEVQSSRAPVCLFLLSWICILCV